MAQASRTEGSVSVEDTIMEEEPSHPPVSDDDYKRLRTLVSRVFQDKHVEFLPIKDVSASVNRLLL